MFTLVRTLLVVLAGVSLDARCAQLEVDVKDTAGAAVADAVASLRPHGSSAAHADAGATMDQRGLRFIPRVLAVQAGTTVDFPNSDQVRHHVYSFSAAKTFELRLYQARPAAPVVFDKPGLVTLGCNIHDWMLGYVLVVDTPYFATTGVDGTASIDDLPAGDYDLDVWQPRLATSPQPFTRPLHLDGGRSVQTVTLILDAPEPEPAPPSELEQKFRRYQQKSDGA
jgi:plastocyanin